MRAAIIALAAVIAAGMPAVASGGLGCDADDLSLKFSTEIAMTRGSGGFFNVRAALDVAMEGVPDDLRKLTLDDALVHSWLDDDEVKLLFYVEREDGQFATVDFVVETSRVREGEYRGDYILTIFELRPDTESGFAAWAAQGYVLCLVE